MYCMGLGTLCIGMGLGTLIASHLTAYFISMRYFLSGLPSLSHICVFIYVISSISLTTYNATGALYDNKQHY